MNWLIDLSNGWLTNLYPVLSFSSFTVLTTPPLNVQARNRTSPSSISVTWEAPPSDVIPGILTGYHVTYTPVSQVGERLVNQTTSVKIVHSPQTETVLEGLSSYTTYCVQVAAVTSQGVGAFSDRRYAGTF